MIDVFSMWLTRVDQPAVRFRGTIQPAPQVSVSADSLAEPRLLLRTRLGEPVDLRHNVRDSAGRVYLVARYDEPQWDPDRSGQVFRLIRMTELVPWRRGATRNDPVTGRPREGALQTISNIWITREMRGLEMMDRGLRVAEDQNRFFTGAEVQMGDTVGDMVVKRLLTTFGVSIGEVQ